MAAETLMGFMEILALRRGSPVDASKAWPSMVQRSPGGVGGGAGGTTAPPLGLRAGCQDPIAPVCAQSAHGINRSTAKLRMFDLQLHMRRRSGVRRNRKW